MQETKILRELVKQEEELDTRRSSVSQGQLWMNTEPWEDEKLGRTLPASFFFFFLVLGLGHTLHCMQDLSFLTRDRTCAHCSGSVESYHWTTLEAPLPASRLCFLRAPTSWLHSSSIPSLFPLCSGECQVALPTVDSTSSSSIYYLF